MTREAIFQLKNLDVFKRDTQVFSGLTLNITLGENVAILGPNGAGKTTLVQLLTRDLLPVVKEGSELRLFGEEHIQIDEYRIKIGLVSHDFQEQHLTLSSARDVVISGFFGSVGIHGHHEVTANMPEQADRLLKQLKIGFLAEKKFLQLSTGQKRRVLLARALVHDPQVLIFDEPTSGLDIAATQQLLDDMRGFCRSDKTLIVVTHHLQEILPEMTRVIMLKEGKVFADGSPEMLINSEKISALFDCNISV